MTVSIATALSFESFDGETLQFRNPLPIMPKINRRRLPTHVPGVPQARGDEVRGNRVLQLRR
jgi:hypothetical protein